MILKRLLSFLCLCSLSCTCLVTSTLAQSAGVDDAPCHHMEVMDMGGEEPQKENCCTEKTEAWREAVQQDDGTELDDIPVAFQTHNYLDFQRPAETPYRSDASHQEPRPSAYLYSWNKIRLIL